MFALTDGDVEALPRVKTLTSPPKSVEHQVTTRPVSKRFHDHREIFWETECWDRTGLKNTMQWRTKIQTCLCLMCLLCSKVNTFKLMLVEHMS